jgi:pSer/pThr/pTyr-binding forkhead associated (FHA) protein
MKARMQPNIAGRLSSLMMKPALQTPTTAKQVPPPLLVAELFDKAGNSVATLTRDAEMGIISIGRSQNATIRLPDKGVSRCHASLSWDPVVGAHVLADCESANGTYLNGRRIIGRVTLLDGARIRLGTTNLLYKLRHD